jgi:hypothetical protein
MEYEPFAIQPTFTMPGSNTLAIDSGMNELDPLLNEGATTTTSALVGEYDLALTNDAIAEIEGILRMSRKQRGSGPGSNPRPHQQQRPGRVSGPPNVRPGRWSPKIPEPPKVPKPEDLKSAVAYLMWVVAKFGTRIDESGLDDVIESIFE